MNLNYQADKVSVTKWIQALKSGEFKQITGQLKEDDCYCSLGVFCKVNDIEISEDGMGTILDDCEVGYDGIIKKLKMKQNGDIFLEIIYNLNDVNELSFSEIAEWIEKNVELI